VHASNSEKTFLVTGAAGALGWATASNLLRRGSRVVFLCHTPESGLKLRARLSHGFGAGPFDLLYCDLSRPEAVNQAAARCLEAHPSLDGIAHCAAVFTRERQETPEGLERMFATNHLGPFLLTNLLEGALRRSSPGRVFLTSAPSTTVIDFDDLQSTRKFSPLHAFGATKMANLLHGYELAERLGGRAITVNVFYPGVLRSQLMREASAAVRLAVRLMVRDPAAAGAALALLLTGEVAGDANGRFFHLLEESQTNAYSHDPENRRRLWDASLGLAGGGQTPS
jgi:retinol dehydrogenase-14